MGKRFSWLALVALLMVVIAVIVDPMADANLAGHDENQNGLRDDVDVFLGKQAYSPNEDIAVRLMANAVSVTLQGGFKTQERIDELNKGITTAFACMTVHLGSDRALATTNELGSLILNTAQRKQAYAKVRELGRVPNPDEFLPDDKCPMTTAI